MMNKLMALVLAATLSWQVNAQDSATATDAVKVAVEALVSVAEQKDMSTEEKKQEFERILEDNFDFKVMSVSIVAQYWKKSDKADQERFIELFKQTMVNTYFDLFQQYTNEKVLFLDEKIRKEKYAVIKTEVESQGKKIPVTYKAILRGNKWRAYDFIVEGVSLVRSYNDNYKSFLKRDGLAGLNLELEKKLKEVDEKDKAGA